MFCIGLSYSLLLIRGIRNIIEKNWATVNGGNGKWKRKVETENENGKRNRERVVTAIRTMS